MAKNFLEYDYKHNTVIDIFNDHVLKSGERAFLKKRDKEGWKDLSWNETASQVEAIASYLINSGIKAGAIIPIYAGNRPEWCIADLAILSAGCADAAIYHLTPSGDAAQIAADTRSSICFCEGKAQAENILLRKKEIPSLKKIVVFEDPGFKDDMVITFSDALKEGAAKLQRDEIKERRRAVKNTDTMTVIFTSGIAGQSKGVMLTHSNVMFSLIKYNMRQGLSEGHTVLSILPITTAAERIMGYYSTMLDCGIIAFSRGKDYFLQDLAEIKPVFGIFNSYFSEKIYSSITGKIRKSSTIKKKLFNKAVEIGKQIAPSLMAAKPLSMSQRLKYWIFTRLILARLKSVTGLSRMEGFIVTGSPILPVIHDLFWAMKIYLRKCYGLTESTSILNTDGAPGALQVKSDGWITPFPETEMKTTVDGEILVRGPQIMGGYFNRPQDTQDMFTSDGWYKTGDQGTMDIHGYLNITDRMKDIIITSSGRKIAPTQVESAFTAHPMISQIAVFGDSRKYLGALIVPDFGNLKVWASDNGIKSASNEELIKESRVIAKYEKITDKMNRRSGFAESVKSFKLMPHEFTFTEGEATPSMRIKRKAIAAKYAKEIEALFAE